MNENMNGLTALILFAVLIILFSELRKETKPVKRAKKRYGKKEFIYFARFKPMIGPELPPCDLCDVTFLKSRILIEMSGYQLSIASEKLMDVSIITKKEIEMARYSDAGGAIAGGMIAGPIGAIIGGVGVNKIETKTEILAITYFSHGDIGFVAFDVTKEKLKAREVEKRYAWLKDREKLRIDM